jgi:hypothetical protein
VEVGPDAGTDGGIARVDLTDGVYGDPLPGLTADELARFRTGLDAFVKQESIGSGLGPVFNAAVCRQCHDGPPATGGTNQRVERRFDGGSRTAVSTP